MLLISPGRLIVRTNVPFILHNAMNLTTTPLSTSSRIDVSYFHVLFDYTLERLNRVHIRGVRGRGKSLVS